MKTWITTAAAMALSGLAVISSAHPSHPAQSHTARKAPLICPVTGDRIASVQKAVGHATFKGKTYYFCCGECKPRFQKNPAKFVKNAARSKFEKM